MVCGVGAICGPGGVLSQVMVLLNSDITLTVLQGCGISSRQSAGLEVEAWGGGDGR